MSVIIWLWDHLVYIITESFEPGLHCCIPDIGHVGPDIPHRLANPGRGGHKFGKKSLYLYFKKFIDIFIFIYFINKFWAIFFTSPWAPGTGSGTSRPSRWRPCPWVLHCGCSLQEGLQGPGGGPGGPGQGQGEDDHSSSPHHFSQTGCTLNFNSWRSVDFHF